MVDDSKRTVASFRTPISSVTALLVGIALAIGHDAFYRSLSGRHAPTSSYSIAGFDVSKQQFNLAVGTTFAFLFKAALSIGVVGAYLQIFWRSVRTEQKGLQLIKLDALFSITANIFYFARASVWLHHPLLFALAVVFWCLPIASVITPATLSVQSTLPSPLPVLSKPVPKFDFTSFDFMSGLPLSDGDNYTEYCYAGPSLELDLVATAVGAGGDILSITAPSVNSSWSMDFWGPALTCQNMTGQKRLDVQNNIYDYTISSNTSCYNSYSYLAWVPSTDNFLPFLNSTSGQLSLRTDDLGFGDSNSFMVAVMSAMFENEISLPSFTAPGGCVLIDQLVVDDDDSDKYYNFTEALDRKPLLMAKYFGENPLYECTLSNASYHADFNFVDGTQNIQVSRNTAEGAEPVKPLKCVTGPESISNGVTAGTGMSTALAEMASSSCSTLNVVDKQCVFDPSVLRVLSYQSIADAFARLLRGSMGLAATAASATIVTSTMMTRTIILDTDELAFIEEPYTFHSSGQLYDLTKISKISNGTDYVGLSNAVRPSSRGPLLPALEKLFSDITMSVLSNQFLQPNYTSPYAPDPNSDVTIAHYENIYVYSRSTLWTAYGVAVACALLAVLAGLAALVVNGRGYNHNFSTVLRFSRTAQLIGAQVSEHEGEAYEPLPRRLETVRVLARRAKEQNEEVEDTQNWDRASSAPSMVKASQAPRVSVPLLDELDELRDHA